MPIDPGKLPRDLLDRQWVVVDVWGWYVIKFCETQQGAVKFAHQHALVHPEKTLGIYEVKGMILGDTR